MGNNSLKLKHKQMKRTIQFLFILGILLTSVGNIFAQGYEITVTLKGMEKKPLYMGHYYADKTYVKDTVITDDKGVAVFKGPEKIEGGIYFIVLPTKTIAWEFLMTDDEVFSMSTDTSDYLGHMVIKGSKENQLYLDYSKYMQGNNLKMNKLQQAMKEAGDDKAKQKKVRKDIEELQTEVKAKWDKYVADNPNTFFANIIKAQMYPEVPEFKVPENITNKDSFIQVQTYYYNKKHFFDNIDFSDSKMLRTAYLNNRLKTYFTKMVFNPDTIIKDGDELIKRAEANDDVYRYVVEYMLNLKYETNRMGMDKVLVHVGEKYYLSGRATWVDSTRMEKIKDRVFKTRPNIIGEKAKMRVLKNYLWEINAEKIFSIYQRTIKWRN